MTTAVLRPTVTQVGEPVRKRYRLLAGQHHEPNPNWKGTDYKDPERLIRYEAGDPSCNVVESTRDLVERFPNKFAMIVEGSPDVPVSPQRMAAVTELIENKIWDEADRAFLESLTDDGFQRIVARTSAPKTSEDNRKVNSQLGDDVTAEFQRAYDEQLLVFVNRAGKYNVARRNASAKPVNKQPLEKAGVEGFVSDYLADAAKR